MAKHSTANWNCHSLSHFIQCNQELSGNCQEDIHFFNSDACHEKTDLKVAPIFLLVWHRLFRIWVFRLHRSYSRKVGVMYDNDKDLKVYFLVTRIINFFPVLSRVITLSLLQLMTFWQEIQQFRFDINSFWSLFRVSLQLLKSHFNWNVQFLSLPYTLIKFRRYNKSYSKPYYLAILSNLCTDQTLLMLAEDFQWN